MAVPMEESCVFVVTDSREHSVKHVSARVMGLYAIMVVHVTLVTTVIRNAGVHIHIPAPTATRKPRMIRVMNLRAETVENVLVKRTERYIASVHLVGLASIAR